MPDIEQAVLMTAACKTVDIENGQWVAVLFSGGTYHTGRGTTAWSAVQSAHKISAISKGYAGPKTDREIS